MTSTKSPWLVVFGWIWLHATTLGLGNNLFPSEPSTLDTPMLSSGSNQLHDRLGVPDTGRTRYYNFGISRSNKNVDRVDKTQETAFGDVTQTPNRNTPRENTIPPMGSIHKAAHRLKNYVNPNNSTSKCATYRGMTIILDIHLTIATGTVVKLHMVIGTVNGTPDVKNERKRRNDEDSAGHQDKRHKCVAEEKRLQSVKLNHHDC
ncbi:hypothetical protein CHU98_g782 [Xylaria longipes]|nr:hypothetical protein CHU98_g782 [Xylaria longipes]